MVEGAAGGARWCIRRIAIRLMAALALMISLNACAIPPMVSVAKLAADGVLLAATGKSSTDHGLSLATGEDCATLRVFDREDVCRDVVVAPVEPLPLEVVRDRAGLSAPPTDIGIRTAMADRAMGNAFRPRVAAPPRIVAPARAARPGATPAVRVAALPRPVALPVAVVDGAASTARVRQVAAASPAHLHDRLVTATPGLVVRSRPGLIKVAARDVTAGQDGTLRVNASARQAVPAAMAEVAPATMAEIAKEPEAEAAPAQGLDRLRHLLKRALTFGQDE